MPDKEQPNNDPKISTARLIDDMYRDDNEDDSGRSHASEGADHDTDIVEGELKNDAVLSGEFVSDLTMNPPLPDPAPNHPESATLPETDEPPSPPTMNAHKA